MALNVQKSFQYQPVLNRSGSDQPSSGIGGGSTPITESSVCTMFDNGLLFVNSSIDSLTKTIPVNIGTDFGFAMVQSTTGSCAIAPGTGVTFINALQATSAPGQLIAAIYVAPNTYIIKVN